jgi:hypothetical protein
MWGVTSIKGTEDFQNKTYKKILLLILFFLPPCDTSVVVLSFLKLAGPTPWHAQGEGSVGSLNHCHREARRRDGNKISGQRICATAQSCLTMIRSTTRTFGIIYINGLLHLLCANHPSTDKTQRWAHNFPSSYELDSPGVLCVSSYEHKWNFPQTKIWI